MLETRNLDFSYGKERILNKINFQVQRGQVVALIGPNGSGKSTLLRCLARLLPAPANTVFLTGKPIVEYTRRQIARKIAFLPQIHEPLRQITVWELVAMGRHPYHELGWIRNRSDNERIRWAIDYLQLTSLQHRFVDALSGGEQQRAWLGMVLTQDTPVILLDEPVTYMDLSHQWHLLELILDLKEKFHKTVVVVFHDINHALEVADIIYVLRNGSLYAAGLPETVITRKTLEAVYGICAHVCRVSHCWRPVVVPAGSGRKACCPKRPDHHDLEEDG